MAVKAKHHVDRCPNCQEAIRVGDYIVPFMVNKDGTTTWKHSGCAAKARPLAARNGSVTDPLTGQKTEKLADLDVIQALIRKTLEEEFLASGVNLVSLVTDELTSAKGQFGDEMRRRIDQQVTKAVEASSTLVRKIEVHLPDKIVRPQGEIFHPRFDRVLRLTLAQKSVLLIGPSGCGKSHIAVQLAKTLDRPLGMFSCTAGMTESDLFGSQVPNIHTGEMVFQSTPFIECYENGGIFCLDEMDAGESNVLLKLNGPLSQGELHLPKRKGNPVARMSPDFGLVATANTWGRGADRQYCGRNPIDEASLDRFRIGTIVVDYNRDIERFLCPDLPLYKRLAGYREKMMQHGIRHIISTRFMRDAYDMTQCGDTVDDIEYALLCGWRKEEIEKVMGKVPAWCA